MAKNNIKGKTSKEKSLESSTNDTRTKQKLKTKRATLDKKIPWQYKPDGLDLKTWQILLRKQAAEDSFFGISAIDEEDAPGEYRVINAEKKQEYKVIYRGSKSP